MTGKRDRFGKYVPLHIVLIAIAVMVPILLLVSTRLFDREFDESRALRDAANQSHDTRFALQRLLTLHLDLETAERGFIISRNRAFLAPYGQAERQIALVFEQLDGGQIADGAPRGDLTRLHAESRAKRDFAAEAIAIAQAGRVEEAERLVASGRGKAVMDRIRDLIASLDGYEQGELARRAEEAEHHRAALRHTTILLHTALLALLLIAALIGMRINSGRARALARMRDAHERQAAVFDSAKDGMVILGADGRILSLNRATCEMFGYTIEDIVGEPVGMLYETVPTQEQTEHFLRSIDRSRGAVRPAREFMGRRRDGHVFPTEVAVSVVADSADRTFLAVIRDITERKQVERMKSEFVSVVSHELRTPLTSIAGSLGLLAGGAAGVLPDRAGKLVGIAHSNSARLVRLINDILDIEKIEAGKMVFDIAPVPLGPLLDQGAQANAAFAAGHDVTIAVAPVPEGLAVMADSDRLMQVITNLLSNAAKFSPPGGIVRVTVTPGEDLHRVSVADDGPGIPDEFRGRIFQKFAQADVSDTRQKGGTGLGLAIVAEIMERLNGRIGFESAAGRGTVFHVDIPSATAA